MKKTNILILFLLIAFAVSIIMPAISSAAASASPTELLSRAAKLSDGAKEAKKASVRDYKYKEAEALYNRVIQTKDSPVESAQAEYDLAGIYATAEGKYAKKPDAVKKYNEIIRRYDKPVSELKGTYTPEESEQLKAIAEKAKGSRTTLVKEINKEKSKTWMYKVMDYLVNLTGRRPGFSYWAAIILMTLIVKILITPLTKAQFKSMKEMQKIQPLMKELQEKYKNDQKTLQTKMMELYKEHNVNPFASCFPLLIQMPILIYLYKIIDAYQYQFEAGSFLWIGSKLSHLFSVMVPLANAQVWFTAKNLAEPDLLLVLLYLVSMFISQRLSIVDPTQAEQQKMMAIMFPIMFGFLFAGFPSAFILYWLVFNVLQTAQQYRIIKSGKAEEVAASGGTVQSGESSDSDRVRRRPRRRR